MFLVEFIMQKQTKLRTDVIEPNQNISFPIGTILAIDKFYEKLGFSNVFGKHKKKGIGFNALIKALVSYKLTENLSISRASGWINRGEVLAAFGIESFEERTLFRVLGRIGQNKEEIVSGIQDRLFETYDFEHTNINMDWTSIVLYGTKCPIGKYGYSRDHRPDKKQITLGLSEISSPINVPIGVTIKTGNTVDVTHFCDTYGQVRGRLAPGSLVVFDKGAHSKENTDAILDDMMKYLTSKKLNTSDDKRIDRFDKRRAELVDKDDGVYGNKFVKPSRIDYFYFSEKLQRDQLESKKRKAIRMFDEAKEIQESIDNNRGLPKRFQINNELVDVTYTYQTKLNELSEEEALEFARNAAITGREGFFCLVSSEDLTLEEALETYRKKDSIEKIINSLKNEVEIKPLRVWSEDSIYGAILIGFLAQLIVSLIRYEVKEVKHTSTKFIKNSLMQLTVTVEFEKNGSKRYIYSNFDALNTVILRRNQAFS